MSQTDDLFKTIKKDIKTNVKTSMKKIIQGLQKRIRSVFRLEGVREGHAKWIPTTWIARRSRKSKRLANPTLVDTGALRRSIEASIADNGDEYIIVIGTDKEYARIHQEGGKTIIGGREVILPKREFLFLTAGDERYVAREIEKNV